MLPKKIQRIIFMLQQLIEDNASVLLGSCFCAGGELIKIMQACVPSDGRSLRLQGDRLQHRKVK